MTNMFTSPSYAPGQPTVVQLGILSCQGTENGNSRQPFPYLEGFAKLSRRSSPLYIARFYRISSRDYLWEVVISVNSDLRIVNLHWQLIATNSTRISTGPDTYLYDRRSVIKKHSLCQHTSNHFWRNTLTEFEYNEITLF